MNTRKPRLSASVHRTGRDPWSTPQGPSGLTPEKVRGPIAPMHESTFAKWRRVRRQAKLIGEPSLSLGSGLVIAIGLSAALLVVAFS